MEREDSYSVDPLLTWAMVFDSQIMNIVPIMQLVHMFDNVFGNLY